MVSWRPAWEGGGRFPLSDCPKVMAAEAKSATSVYTDQFVGKSNELARKGFVAEV